MRRPSPYAAAAAPSDMHPPPPPLPSMRLAQINLSTAHSPYARLPYASSLPLAQPTRTLMAQRGAGAGATRRRRNSNPGLVTTRANTRPASATVRNPHAAHGVARAVWMAAAAPPGTYQQQHATPSRPTTARPPQQQPQQPPSARTPVRPASARPAFTFAPSPPARPSPAAAVAARPSPPAATAAPPPPPTTLHEIHRPRRKHHATSDFAPERSSSYAAYQLAAEPVQPAYPSRAPVFHSLLNAQPNPNHARQMQLLDQQLRNPPAPADRYEATFDTEESDAPAEPPPIAAPEALSPGSAEALLGFGGGGGGGGGGPSRRSKAKRPPAAAAAASSPFFDRPPPVQMPVPPPPVSPPEGWSAAPSPLAVDDSDRPLPFHVDWTKELLLATGPADLVGVASPPSRTASTGPDAEEQLQWQPVESAEPPPPAPQQPLSIVPLFILQRRERERVAQEQRRAREASAAAAEAAAMSPVPPLSFLSPPPPAAASNAAAADDDDDDAAYDDDFECEQKEESAPAVAAATAIAPPARPSSARYGGSDRSTVVSGPHSARSAQAPRRPSSARPRVSVGTSSPSPSPRHMHSARSTEMRAPDKPSAAGRDDEAAIDFFIAEEPAPTQGTAAIASQPPFFNVRTHRGKRKPLSGK